MLYLEVEPHVHLGGGLPSADSPAFEPRFVDDDCYIVHGDTEPCVDPVDNAPVEFLLGIGSPTRERGDLDQDRVGSPVRREFEIVGGVYLEALETVEIGDFKHLDECGMNDIEEFLFGIAARGGGVRIAQGDFY